MKIEHSTTCMAPNEVVNGVKSRVFYFNPEDELIIPAEHETEEAAIDALQNKILLNQVQFIT